MNGGCTGFVLPVDLWLGVLIFQHTYQLTMRSLILAAIIIAGPMLQAQTDAARQIDSYITPFANARHFSGEVVVAKNGKPIFQKAYGFANAELGVRNQLDTRIGIASITKSMTAVILLKLVDEKKIALTDLVLKYIPDFPNGDRITVDMLANHRSGIPHRVMPEEMETVSYTSEEMVNKVKLAKLEFEPGAKYFYSSAGYAVLARILEIASGKSYASLLDQYVFKPAKMTSSFEYDRASIIERRASDYLLDGHGLLNAPAKDLSFLVGAGSVVSTAGDVHRFAMAITSGAYGDEIRANYLQNKTWTSTGNTNGHNAEVRVDGAKGYSYAIVSNLNAGANAVIAQGIRDIMEGKNVGAPAVAHPVITSRTEAELSQYLGDYEREGGGRFTTKVRNDVLYAGDIKLEPTTKDCFFDFKYYGDVCFVRDGEGKILHITWASPGITSKWVKK